ncbi:MAG TPA: Gfo/Idh/MocA family oxidoreductase [Nocardioides sp.]|uniref:Gfo/Idh/MocA family protein n=1 Tax=Nocardioides sp. TaxID=35761 RepID=UPI002D7E32D4|nr:Gfo/Idh/MocA family oxidoreductase [Nocardioides sp.]HET6652466.1 Gfo/Idh/MocA family oxidoreductase [Nocardioides sp.]
MAPTTVPTRLPNDLPPPAVTPGPVRATPLPADRPVRWGILATGRIARSFATALALLPDAEIAAVGARRLAAAEEFAAAYGARRAHGGYASLVADPDVDVVYVASPHSLHREHVLMAFDAGKAVLCEKALTLTGDEAAELVSESRRRGLFLMEAMWMRCNPVIRRVQQLLATGDLGQVTQVRADLGWYVEAPPTDRLLDPMLGGGALLDMGVYTLAFAHLFLGEPDALAAVAGLGDSGIDLNVAMSLGYASGAVASLTASMTGATPRTGSIATERGRFDLADSFHHPVRATWTSDEVTETVEAPLLGNGLAHEAKEVMRCLRAGETESPLVPLDESVAIMRQMDRIRREIGVTYAADRQD